MHSSATEVRDIPTVHGGATQLTVEVGDGHPEVAQRETSVGRSFERQVRLGPDRPAIVGQHETLSYDALNRRANQYARACAEDAKDVAKPVAALLPKDGSLFAALLAALKIGRPYVLLDPEMPAPRLMRFLQDSGADTIVADQARQSLASELARGVARTPRVLLAEEIGARGYAETDLESAPPDDALAYLIYTSGSTGAPKGVVQLQRNVLEYTRRQMTALHLTSHDRLTLLASAGTGQAATDMFASLLSGASLHPVDVRQVGFDWLARWIRDRQITVYHSSASIFRSLLAALGETDVFPHVRIVKLGSEPVYRRDVEGWLRHFPTSGVFVNALTSSETGLIRHMEIAHGDVLDDGALVPVGYAVDGVDVHLVDEHGQPVGPDHAGEIVVRSEYLSPGYWGDPTRTAKAFQPDPDGGVARLFATGDRGRLTSDGRLVYLGRADGQIKIRGFRVECADVQAAIVEDPDVSEAVVRPNREGDGDAALVAYVVPRGGAALRGRELATRLRARLPDSMVPASFVVMDALPLTPSGKVDVQALPAPTSGRILAGADAALSDARRPRTVLERQLAAIWEQVLGSGPVGVHDDFFDLGGHSLLAIRMIDQVERFCGIRVPLSTLMRGPTIEELTAVILTADPHRMEPPLVVLNADGSRRPFIFFHGQLNGGGFYCRRLAQQLGSDRPLAVIAPHGHDGGQIPGTIEAMASDRLQALRSFQPRGPYLLGGYCNGGLVAYEMARQLVEQGESVRLVALIDVSAINTRFAWLRTLVAGPGAVLRLDHETQARLFGTLREVAIALRNEPHHVPAMCLNAMRRRGRAAAGRSRPAPTGLAGAAMRSREGRTFDEIYLESVLVYRGIMDRYVPRPHSDRVVLFHSTTTRARAANDPSAGWRRVLPDVGLYPVDGDHESCVVDHLDALAGRIAGELTRADTLIGERELG